MSALELCPECRSPRVTITNTNTDACYELKCHSCGLVYIVPGIEEGGSKYDAYDGPDIKVEHGQLIYL